MRSGKVGKIAAYQSPDSGQWEGVKGAAVELMPTPLELQPNEYIKNSWRDRPFGRVTRLDVASVHDGRRVAFRIQWQSKIESRGDGENFPDGVALAFPVDGDPDLSTMGSAKAPIHALHWSARNSELRSVLTTGIGSSRAGPQIDASAKAIWRLGAWRIVIVRDLAAPKGASLFAPGKTFKIGFAIWNGANKERAGIKAYSIDWLDLAIEP